MKVGDLIKLPQNMGYAIAMKIVNHGHDPAMPVGETAVMVMEEGEEWWDASCCEVVNESR